jgi:hypothetical protein
MLKAYARLIGIAALTSVSFTMCTSQTLAGPRCPPAKTYVSKWGCVLKVEVAKAKRICRNLKPPQKDFRECLCQDGTQIGACGN